MNPVVVPELYIRILEAITVVSIALNIILMYSVWKLQDKFYLDVKNLIKALKNVARW